MKVLLPLLLLLDVFASNYAKKGKGKGVVADDKEKSLDAKLFIAAGQGNAETVQSLLDEGANPNYAKKDTGETPLHVSGIKCNKDTVAALVEAGANVNAQTLPGITISMSVMHWFVNMGGCDMEAVQMLLDAGADLAMKNEKGMTALYMASRIKGREHMVDALRIHCSSKGIEGCGGEAHDGEL